MARVTVEDCIEKIPSRFELVLLSAKRARDIAAGATITVSRDNDKNAVVALREIAEDNINFDDIRNSIIKDNQRNFILDDDESDLDEELQEILNASSKSPTTEVAAEDVNQLSEAQEETPSEE